MRNKLTRRSILSNGLYALTVVPPAAAFGCGGRLDCSDTSGLSPEDARMRAAQNYLDTSPDPAKACDRCAQWTAPQGEGCGGCKVLKGSINPKGTCALFVAKS